MTATIRDPNVLRAVSPPDLVAYLSSSGWREAEAIGDKGAAWVYSAPQGTEFEILVPLRTDLGDYIYRIADALHTLEVVEQRSPVEILVDLMTAGDDVSRVDLLGFVTRLDRDPAELGGKVTVHAFLEEGPRKVSFDLDEPDYQLAVRAHADRLLVRCTGQLVKAGHLLSLHQPHGFELLDDA